METGIPAAAWLAEGDRAVDTAMELLDDARREAERRNRG